MMVGAPDFSSGKNGVFDAGVGNDTPPQVGSCRANFGCRIGTIKKSATSKFPSLSVNLLNMKEWQKPKQLRKNLWRRSPYGPFGYLVTFSPDRHTNKRRIPEIWPQ